MASFDLHCNLGNKTFPLIIENRPGGELSLSKADFGIDTFY